MVYFILFRVAIFLVLIYAGVVLMGVAEFKWKTPPLPPEQDVSDAEQQASKVGEYLSRQYDDRFEVRSVNGRFQVLTSPDCPLPDATILSSLTSKFPRLVFRISRSLFDTAGTFRRPEQTQRSSGMM